MPGLEKRGSIATRAGEWLPTALPELPRLRRAAREDHDANQGSESIHDVWVDERGVFALLGATCDEWAGVPCGEDRASLRLSARRGLLEAQPRWNYSHWNR